MPKTELRRLREKHSKLYFEWFEVGRKIRDLEVTQPKPQDRIEREHRENWNLTMGILKKVGFIKTDNWNDVGSGDKHPIWALHKVRRDVREAIGRALGVIK